MGDQDEHGWNGAVDGQSGRWWGHRQEQMLLFHSVSLLLCSYRLLPRQCQECRTFTCGCPSPSGSTQASAADSGHFCWAPHRRAKEVCEWAGPRGLWVREETAGNYSLWGSLSQAGLSYPECLRVSHLTPFSLVNVYFPLTDGSYKVCMVSNLEKSAVFTFPVRICE